MYQRPNSYLPSPVFRPPNAKSLSTKHGFPSTKCQIPVHQAWFPVHQMPDSCPPSLVSRPPNAESLSTKPGFPSTKCRIPIHQAEFPINLIPYFYLRSSTFLRNWVTSANDSLVIPWPMGNSLKMGPYPACFRAFTVFWVQSSVTTMS